MEKQASTVTIDTLAYLAGMSSANSTSYAGQELNAEQPAETTHQHSVNLPEPIIKPLNF